MIFKLGGSISASRIHRAVLQLIIASLCVLTIAVACCLVDMRTSYETHETRVDATVWSVLVEHQFGRRKVLVLQYKGTNAITQLEQYDHTIIDSRLITLILGRGSTDVEIFSCIESGWPFKAFGAYQTGTWDDYRQDALNTHGGEVVKAGAVGKYWVIPLLPVWPGLLLDIALVLIVFRVTSFGISRIVVARRRARGLCSKCRYPVIGSLKCPECGCAVA